MIEAGLLPKAPSELSAKAGEGKSIRLEWSDNANNERGYRVERFNGQEFVQIAALAANTEAYTDTDIDYGNTYRYRVKAYNNGGVSQPSNEDEVTIYDYAGLGSTGKVIGIVQPLPLPKRPKLWSKPLPLRRPDSWTNLPTRTALSWKKNVAVPSKNRRLTGRGCQLYRQRPRCRDQVYLPDQVLQ